MIVATFAEDGPTTCSSLPVERYSADREWMPRLVMLAKSTYVWLDQLSKQYQRSITRLDQIPDEELWAARQVLRHTLFQFVRDQARKYWTQDQSTGRVVAAGAISR